MKIYELLNKNDYFCRCNAIIFINSTHNEYNSCRRIFEDVSVQNVVASEPIIVDYHEVNNSQEFFGVFNRLIGLAQHGHFYPFIHIEGHGDKNDGLFTQWADDMISWERLGVLFRKLNIEIKNNLQISLPCCFGTHVAFSTKITEPSIAYSILAPSDVTDAKDFEVSLTNFYKELLASNDFVHSLLSAKPKIDFIHSERLFLKSFLNYYNLESSRKARNKRVDRLISQIDNGILKQVGLKLARSFLKGKVSDFSAAFDRMKNCFLMADCPENIGRFKYSFDDFKGTLIE